jgi:hypothetical protein
MGTKRLNDDRDELTEAQIEMLQFGFRLLGHNEPVDREMYEAHADKIESSWRKKKGLFKRTWSWWRWAAPEARRRIVSGSMVAAVDEAAAPDWARAKGVSFGVPNVFQPSEGLRVESQFAFLLRHRELLTSEEAEAVAGGIQRPMDYDPVADSSIEN